MEYNNNNMNDINNQNNSSSKPAIDNNINNNNDFTPLTPKQVKIFTFIISVLLLCQSIIRLLHFKDLSFTTFILTLYYM